MTTPIGPFQSVRLQSAGSLFSPLMVFLQAPRPGDAPISRPLSIPRQHYARRRVLTPSRRSGMMRAPDWEKRGDSEFLKPPD